MPLRLIVLIGMTSYLTLADDIIPLDEPITKSGDGNDQIIDTNIDEKKACSELTVEERRYRQIDGRCNHRKDYGETARPVKRRLRAHYQDENRRNAPKMSSSMDGSDLPSPRLISRMLFPDKSAIGNRTTWFMQLGQIIDHDITQSPTPTALNSSIRCCSLPSEDIPEECFPIKVPQDDPKLDPCMEFVRSLPAYDVDGHMILPREQLNMLTSFVDASFVYGCDTRTARRLRAQNGTGALLKTFLVDGKERLPIDETARRFDCLGTGPPHSYCQLAGESLIDKAGIRLAEVLSYTKARGTFLTSAGDRRVNEQPALGSAHLLFHLYHNHLIRQLARAILEKSGSHPSQQQVEEFIELASDGLKEALYQEGRKILGAILQKILFCEWLPVVLGPDLIARYTLGCDTSSQYDPDTDPRIANVFMTAAFRFGHTLIPNTFLTGSGRYQLKESFMVPDRSLASFESIISGLLEDGSTEAFDRYISSAVTQHLFETRDGPRHALDLISLNIQRGRDHGIPGYYFWRRFYGLRRYKSLDAFENYATTMKSLYKHILDVDLFVGGVLEKPVPGGVVGETFGHIIAHQLKDLKFGDAYFFLSQEAPQRFSNEQIESIKRVGFNTILCNVIGLKTIQENPFYLTSDRNPSRSCFDFPDLDVASWVSMF